MTTNMKEGRGDFRMKTVLDGRAFAAISAVEGLRLSDASKARLQKLRAGNMSHAEQRAEIARAYRASTTSK